MTGTAQIAVPVRHPQELLAGIPVVMDIVAAWTFQTAFPEYVLEGVRADLRILSDLVIPDARIEKSYRVLIGKSTPGSDLKCLPDIPVARYRTVAVYGHRAVMATQTKFGNRPRALRKARAQLVRGAAWRCSSAAVKSE